MLFTGRTLRNQDASDGGNSAILSTPRISINDWIRELNKEREQLGFLEVTISNQGGTVMIGGAVPWSQRDIFLQFVSDRAVQKGTAIACPHPIYGEADGRPMAFFFTDI